MLKILWVIIGVFLSGITKTNQFFRRSQAIPIYTMSCFNISITICKEIEASANFWWGSNNVQRKIHWCSKKRLCLPKENEGMGFRSISLFNQTLLAKTSWALCNRMDSLLFKVLRGKYFPHTSFLNAKLGNVHSFTRTSIVWGHELFKKGYRWKVGRSFSISIKKDPWLLSHSHREFHF